MNNVLQTVISQYGNSPTLLTLINSYNDSIDPTNDIDNFYNDVWNIETAVGFGLDIWGVILGVGRVLQVASSTYFGFTGVNGRTEASGDALGGGPTTPAESPFYSGQPGTNNYALADSAYRQLLLAKAAYNITSGSIPAINAILQALFVTNVPGRAGNAYCTDGGNMTMTYTFSMTPLLTPVEEAIITQSGALPRPCGVSATYVQ